jgi:hypothetical protein
MFSADVNTLQKTLLLLLALCRACPGLRCVRRRSTPAASLGACGVPFIVCITWSSRQSGCVCKACAVVARGCCCGACGARENRPPRNVLVPPSVDPLIMEPVAAGADWRVIGRMYNGTLAPSHAQMEPPLCGAHTGRHRGTGRVYFAISVCSARAHEPPRCTPGCLTSLCRIVVCRTVDACATVECVLPARKPCPHLSLRPEVGPQPLTRVRCCPWIVLAW